MFAMLLNISSPHVWGRGRYARLATSLNVLGGERDRSNSREDSVGDYERLAVADWRLEKPKSRLHRCSRKIFALVFLLIAGIAWTVVSSTLNQKVDAEITTSGLPRWPPSFTSHGAFTRHAFDSWIGQGQLPNDTTSVDFSQHARIDSISTWVNGTDPRHIAARTCFAANATRIDHKEEGCIEKTSKSKATSDTDKALQNDDVRFREQNELLYSLRSFRSNLQENLGTMHVLMTDWWEDSSFRLEGRSDRLFQGRRGQIPSWLNITSSSFAFGIDNINKTPALRIHHNWETFQPMTQYQDSLENWKIKRLPSFNSMAVESALGAGLPGLAEFAFLASDDIFLGRQMSTADFITPLYGPILDLKMSVLFKVGQRPHTTGENAGMFHSFDMLSKRFGAKQFPYPEHNQKSFSKPLLIESRMMWKNEFEETTLHRFRGNGLLANSHMLLYGLIVERHREALLWSFLVSKIDTNGDGVLDDVEKGRAFQLMGTDGTSDIIGRLSLRTTIRLENIHKSLQQASFPRPLEAKYRFSSLDGYLLNVPSPEYSKTTGYRLENGPLQFSLKDRKTSEQDLRSLPPFCRVSMTICWSHENHTTTSEIFTRFAFEEPSCGNCLIMHLIHQSGNSGLEAFLPEEGLVFPRNGIKRPKVPLSVPAHLPIGDDWKTLNFSLSSIAANNRRGWKRREFSIQLIHRYNYVVGAANFQYHDLWNPSSVKQTFNTLRYSRPAYFCLNDNIFEKLSEVRSILQSSFESMWPSSTSRMPFEKDTIE